jgi:predicted nucleotidyltransferase
MVKRIVKRFHPEKIILFGSHARGEAGLDSDVDLLVVMPVVGSVVEHRLEIRAALHDMPVPIDVVVSSPDDFAWRKDVVGTIEWPATREGKILYRLELPRHRGTPEGTRYGSGPGHRRVRGRPGLSLEGET